MHGNHALMYIHSQPTTAGAQTPRRRLVEAPWYVAIEEKAMYLKQEARYARIYLVSTAISVATTARNRYVLRGRNELHTIFERHFADFCEHYEEKYAATYGRYRLERIQQIGERFCTIGDYLKGVARVRCTNRECGLVGAFGICSTMHPGHDYFRPFSCKGFYLCPWMHGRAVSAANDQPLSLGKIH
jgi:hypothetical protein